ncbi:MAG: MerR family DNA-binding transcriptional regulator [Methanohalobium sp.]
MYNIKQASEYLGVNPETLRRWEREGKINPERTY